MGTATATRERHLLLVEDEPGDAELVREAIGLRPIRIHRAETVVSAFHFLDRQIGFGDAPTPDLILLDLRLPVFAGTVLLEERRRRGRWLDIPVVVYTSSDREREACLAQGAIDYLRKPAAWADWQVFVDGLIERYLS